MTGRLILLVRLSLAGLMVLIAGPLAAHTTPNSEVRFRAAGDVVIADIIVPRSEYAFGTGNPVGDDSHSRRIARNYLSERIGVASRAGRKWSVAFQTVEFVTSDGPPDLHAVATLTPPAGASASELVIDWRVLTDTVTGHFVLFLMDGDSEGAVLGASQAGSVPVDISLADQGGLRTVGASMMVGAHHILEGYDHLLFLLVLLLPAPLLAASGRWTGRRSYRRTIIKLTKIVTAFTIGHSLTLIFATVGKVSLPSAPVEIAIAISVLVSAMHAARPLLPGKEPLIALAFGLIHGLAFATLVQEANAGAANSALTLLGFNLGIELVQLGIVAAVLPSLLVLSRYPFYAALRWMLALFSATAAMAWIVNRVSGHGEAAVVSLETAIGLTGWLVPITALLSLFLYVLKAPEDRRGLGRQAVAR